jgi:(2Fe-2S) ferredoxin
MRRHELAPQAHLFVCANRRDAASPLGPGCGDHGARVFAQMKAEVARLRAYGQLWVTQTACLGLCPKVGAAVAVYPRQRLLTEVMPEDADALVREALDGGDR